MHQKNKVKKKKDGMMSDYRDGQMDQYVTKTILVKYRL